ncbi:hypothetical protein OG778_36365 (plasmid) [Streptomyces sp. NBC_00184]|uniref:hypothetical protein n=1 Tax=Streptomyces sp. NBC_00184 TaxID=2975673 RepID=UPI002E299760|nr:hypothetical protein [Streptomyces sp. NBC_00184]
MRIATGVMERARDTAEDALLDEDPHQLSNTWAVLGELGYAARHGQELPYGIDSVSWIGEQGADIVRGVINTLNTRLDGYPVPGFPPTWSLPREPWSDDDYDDDAIESADDALKRQSQGEIINEVLAGGAVAASFTAAASVAKAKIEATTQRERNKQDTETERLRIASQERIAGLQAASTPV